MNSVEWNPKYNLLAYAGDDKNKYQADEGNFNIILIPKYTVHFFIEKDLNFTKEKALNFQCFSLKYIIILKSIDK